MKIARTVAFVFLVAIETSGYPSGAPVSRCDTMVPGHSVLPQTEDSPYSITISSDKYPPGGTLSVTVTDTSTVSSGFKGILMQMRRKDSDGVVGTWTVENTANFRTISCNGNPDAVTHANGNDKGATNTFTWTAPQDSNPGDVYVVATFVKDFSTFWVEQTSSYIGAN
ncbi:putative defense protein 3 isoform X3 [Lytechinus variegatus]|uniref:putative defense protein 3 isoform X3 n=1 Tax=Lytechinus variegatus TaxID=7654 RepID=UPI001BB2628B|nr:putative defense protein 3 isoform X3 [Lytechinus variegatus]XP_041455742.1 putative defense protein 3 isoform X3 [Lytechinus variegatus]